MAIKELSSLQHPLVKQAVRLRLEREERERMGLVLVSGKKLLSDLADFYPIHTLFLTDPSKNSLEAQECYQVSAEILKKISGVETKEGCAALVPLPPPQTLENKQRLLILDRISDPCNLGTLLRTALALGWEGVWLLPGTVDLFNDKALRAGKGATFRLPYEQITSEQVICWAKEKKGSIFAADLGGEPLASHPKMKTPLALLLGSEGQGIGDWAASFHKISIAMQNGIESLNVASAGAILLYELRPSR